MKSFWLDFFFFSSRRRHTRSLCDWSSDVCSSDLWCWLQRCCATSSSGTLTTSVPNALLVAGNIVATSTSGPGASFTNRMITNPDGDIAEDRVAATAGSYSATAPMNSSGYWIMQMAAFKAQTLGTNTAPTISGIPAQVTNEDTPSSTIGFTVGDAET